MDLKSNEPFWLVKDGLVTSYPSLRAPEQCDVLIIGGGITGSLVAHQCVADGYDTILIDKREIGNGSSSATTSMLQYEIDTPLYKLIEQIGKKGAEASYHACSAAIDRLEKIAKTVRSKAGFTRKSSLYFAARKKDVSWLEKEYEARQAAGFEVTWLSEEAIQQQYGLQKAYGGILSAQGASVDAFLLLHELLDYNRKRGLRVYDKTALSKVTRHQGKNRCHVDTGQVITAKKIVYCVGYESNLLIPEKFVDLISTFAIVSEVDPVLHKKFEEVLLWNTNDPYLYLRTTDDGRMLIGGEDEDFHNPEKRDALIRKKARKLARHFNKLIPDNPFYSDFAWAGTFGTTKDGLPYIGEHAAFKGAYFVLGFGGNGITFSVTGMDLVSTWLRGEKHDLEPYFAFGR